MAVVLPQRHPFEPVWDTRSRLLILGSFPSVLSRANGFYYGNPRNRFWQVLGRVLGEPVPDDTNGKRNYLLRHGIALWDVLRSCDIAGSSDASITNAVPNDLLPLLQGSAITRVFANGAAAGRVYQKHQEPVTGLPITVLPSTSPANAAWSVDRLVQAWQVIL